MKLIRETMSREITEVFLPKEYTIDYKGEKFVAMKYLRIAKFNRIVESGRSIFQKNVVEYQYETYIGKERQWNRMNKRDYDNIVELTKGWTPDYRGSFKVSQKIIGITFK